MSGSLVLWTDHKGVWVSKTVLTLNAASPSKPGDQERWQSCSNGWPGQERPAVLEMLFPG